VVAFGFDSSVYPITAAVVGSLLGFLVFNVYPAKVFMGDTGSLALGGLIAVTTALTRQYLLMCIIGVLYVLTTLSVIIQVVVFKVTKGKRVFKMSPLHHHFEVSSHEAKVTLVYALITLVVGVVTIVAYL
jgi:phospho-N-acetylmuramoyl-pentapeptide-transferase